MSRAQEQTLALQVAEAQAKGAEEKGAQAKGAEEKGTDVSQQTLLPNEPAVGLAHLQSRAAPSQCSARQSGEKPPAFEPPLPVFLPRQCSKGLAGARSGRNFFYEIWLADNGDRLNQFPFFF